MKTVQQIAESTSEAYSWGRYNSWEACIKALKKMGLTDNEVEAILLSKWTRWAADSSSAPYGKATSKDLMRYIEKSESPESIKRLTQETFGSV